ncbi:hypothetical protein [Pseudomonas aeruginosa]|uniref:hypothetical protein n=1 Tax=Pseudomonas aeruginosa TaxID=287 RepID=UPI00070D938B|nr:hypothetical protein [Pseudomonas aeruginosa]
MTNELTDVRCPCGDEYPADSYDAGFIAGSGMCQTCDAALPSKDICTCPSGDGSLAHPCPAHPAVEQAGGDERVIGWRERILAAYPNSDPGFWPDALLVEHMAAEIADLRAALAQPSPKCTTCNDSGVIGGFVGADSGYQDDPCPDCAQAEAERPEVVAWQYRVTAGPQTGWSLWHPGKGEEFERSYTVERRPLMTIAQHERITAQLHDALDESDGDRWKLRSERDAANARLHEVAVACATAEQERDAALARVAELELKLDKSDYAYDNDRIHMRGLAARAIARAKVFDDGSDGADAESARSVVAILRELLAVGPAQAQHSVPDGYRLIRLDHFAAIKAQLDPKQVDAYRGRNIYDEDKVYANWNECRSALDEIKDVFQQIDWDAENELAELLAAAPGTEVPQAWLDVQSERRRQINVEGWTPEHDDKHETGALASAAGCYAMFSLAYPAGDPSHFWPWDKSWWKPSPDGRRNMVKAGALILAEIERLDRAGAGKEEA